jgi:SAM-dependent methyltransferase
MNETRSNRSLRLLFGAVIFLSSFLLFLVEPIAARQLLPVFGGSAAVWVTCLVLFQTALLVAYLYAHWLALRPNWLVHTVLLLAAAGSALVWTWHTVVPATTHPVLDIFIALSINIGLPFLALGATSPLLQVWVARIETGGIPYRLYALSNLASLLALLAYPTIIEPYLTLKNQRLIWCCGFAVFAGLSAFVMQKTRAATVTRPSLAAIDESQIPAASFTAKLLWVLLPMGAAMQLSAVTSYLTANIAAIPLLWILPLAVYLITLIIAFQFTGLIPRGILTRLLVIMLAGLGYMLTQSDVSLPMRTVIGFFLAEVFFACLFCHTEACNLRPRRPSESTLFYLLFATGGALGSFLVGVASPPLFLFNYDLALTFLVTAALALAVTWSGGWPQRLLWTTACILLCVLVGMLYVGYERGTLFAVRNFYGSLRVRQSISYSGAITRTLTNGTIQHGTQIFSPELRRTPTTYYAEDSGIGLALRFCCGDRPRKIGVVGLGAGTIAAYGRPGDQIRFYEINPAVEPIARNLFSYLRESQAQVTVVEGDARNSLAHEATQQFDVLVIDAFSGDAIPIHLLTSQAVTLYKSHLAPGGILAFHISNQHVDLEPEVALLAQSAGLTVRRVSTFADDARGEFSATWMLATENDAFFSIPAVQSAARGPVLDPRVHLWTDDYSSLLPLIH